MPPAPAFAAQLNEQIGNEFAAHQQYVACAVYYDSEALPRLAGFFYRQALEEQPSLAPKPRPKRDYRRRRKA